jgi:hypothetical protein
MIENLSHNPRIADLILATGIGREREREREKERESFGVKVNSSA